MKIQTQLINIPNNKKNRNKLMTRSCGLLPTNARCILSQLRHFYVHVCYIHLVKDGFHTAGRGIWIIDVFML